VRRANKLGTPGVIFEAQGSPRAFLNIDFTSYMVRFSRFFTLLSAATFSLAAWGQTPDYVEMMQDHSINFYDVVDAFNSHWEGQSVEKGRGWKQFKRWEAFMEPRVFPSGTRPVPQSLYQGYLAGAQGTATSSVGGLGNWSIVGPFDGNSLNGIGRVNVIAFHPTQANTLFAGAPAGGLWKSTDDGLTWSTNTDLLPNLGVSAILIDPTNPLIMYIGTGDRDAGDTYSLGVMKSTDGGLTWNPTGLSFNLTQSARIVGMAMHKDSTHHLVAATRNGILRSLDGGATWTTEAGGTFGCLVQVPGTNKLFAGTSSNGRIWMSTDFGDTWTMLTNGLPTSAGRVELATTTADTNYVYALYGANNNGLYGVYRTTNGGTSWTQRHGASPNLLDWSTNGSGSGGQAWYDLAIAVSPLDKDVVLTGGVNVWRSNNGGSSFALSGHWYGGGGASFVHADHHWMIFKPGTNAVYAGCDGGVYKSASSGMNNSWVSRNIGLSITQYYKIGTTEADTTLTIAGAQDNGTHLNDNGWDKVGGGDGMDCAISAADGNTMYRSIYYGDFDKSTNGGITFNAPFNLPPSGTGNWVTPFLASRINSNTLYAGFTKLWKSTNAGGTFSATSTNNIQGASNIDCIAEALSNPNVLYVGIDERLFQSTDGGQTWTWISSNIGSSSVITGIAVDPLDENHVWISKSGYYAGTKVYETFNAGGAWYNRSGSLPNIPANCIAIQPSSNGLVYVGTDLGVYYRDASMSDWVPFMQGLPNTIVNDIEILSNAGKIRIGTYGRGVWESPLATFFQERPEADFSTSHQALCSTSDTVTLTDASSNYPTAWSWTIYPQTFTYVNGSSSSDSDPQVVFTANGRYTVQLVASNAYGSDTLTRISYIHVGGIQVPAGEQFDDHPLDGRWSTVNPDFGQGWNISTVGSQYVYSAVFEGFGYGSTGQKDDLISPPYLIDSVTTLVYDLAYRPLTGAASDTLNIYISSDCGNTWNLLRQYVETGNNSFATGSAITTAFVPSSSSDWNRDTIQLAGYSGQVRFKFEAISGNGNNIYLDWLLLLTPNVAAPVADFFSDTTTCVNKSTTIYFSGTGQGVSFSWSFPGGTPSTSTSYYPQVSYATAGVKNVSLTVTNNQGSATVSKTSYLSVASLSTPSVSISANTATACVGDTLTYTANPVNAGSNPVYTWKVNGQQRGGNSASIDLFTLNTGDSIRCVVTSSEDCAAPKKVSSNTVIANILPLPVVTAGTYSAVCVGGAPVNLSGTPVGGVFSGTGVSNGQFLPTTVGQGVYTITYTYMNANGCVNRATSTIQILAAPNVFLNFNVDEVCAADAPFAPSGGYPGGGTYLVDGVAATQIQPSTLTLGWHYLTYVYNNGTCTSERLDSFEIKAAPPVPTVQVFGGDSLYCPQAANGWTIQWLDANQNAISGATQPWYVPGAPGTFYARLKVGLGCFPTSNAVAVTSVDEVDMFALRLSPNPTQGWVDIETAAMPGESFTLRWTDASGAQLHEATYVGTGQVMRVRMDLQGWSNGVYFLERLGADHSSRQRVVKF
jgi:PKD repeat protein